MNEFLTPHGQASPRAADAVVLSRRQLVVVGLLTCIPVPLCSFGAMVVPLPQILERSAASFVTLLAPASHHGDAGVVRERAVAVKGLEIIYRPSEHSVPSRASSMRRVVARAAPRTASPPTKRAVDHATSIPHASVKPSEGPARQGGAEAAADPTHTPAASPEPTSPDQPAPTSPAPPGDRGAPSDTTGGGGSTGDNDPPAGTSAPAPPEPAPAADSSPPTGGGSGDGGQPGSEDAPGNSGSAPGHTAPSGPGSPSQGNPPPDPGGGSGHGASGNGSSNSPDPPPRGGSGRP